MRPAALLSLLLLLLAAACEAAEGGAAVGKRRRRRKPDGADPGFDLFIFVRSYSPTFCKAEACTIRPITAFTIHGLWPEYASGGWPQFCGEEGEESGLESADSGGADGVLADEGEGEEWSEVQPAARESAGDEPLEPAPAPTPQPADAPSEQQKCEWPSFRGPDAGFWDHEWEKHGTCAHPVTGDRPAFFNATMRLHEQLDLDVALAAAGILPSDSQSYARSRLERAVEDAFGVPPMLSCFHGQLEEVWLCVGLDLKPRMCPPGVLKAQRVTCGKEVSLPVGSPVPAECRPYFPPWNAPNSGGKNLMFVRIATGAAVVGAGAAAVLLFVRGAAQRQRRHALPSIPEEEPLLNGWLSKLKGARQASSGSS